MVFFVDQDSRRSQKFSKTFQCYSRHRCQNATQRIDSMELKDVEGMGLVPRNPELHPRYIRYILHPSQPTVHLQVPPQKVLRPSWHPPQTPSQQVLGGLGSPTGPYFNRICDPRPEDSVPNRSRTWGKSVLDTPLSSRWTRGEGGHVRRWQGNKARLGLGAFERGSPGTSNLSSEGGCRWYLPRSSDAYLELG